MTEPDGPGRIPVAAGLGWALARGTVWTAIGRYSNAAIQLAILAILTRVLRPSDFGVVAMILVYTGFVNVLVDAGLGPTVIQRSLTERQVSAAFTLSLVLGLVFAAITIGVAPLLEAFFEYPGLARVVRVMSLSVLAVALVSVPQARMAKALRFPELAAAGILATVGGGAVALTIAVRGGGYWALVVQPIAVNLLLFALLLGFGRWLPRLGFDRTVMTETAGFGGYLVAFSSINYWARNADNLLIGRVLGAASLGQYAQAYRLLTLPIDLITAIVSPALHPVLAGIQEQTRRIAWIYSQISGMMAFVTFPMSAFLFVFAHEVVRVVWGKGWEPCGDVFRVLALLTCIQPLISMTGSVFLAANRPALLFRVGSINAIVMIAGIVAGLRFGIVGVAAGYALSFVLVVVPFTIAALYRALEDSPASFVYALARPCLAGALVLLLCVVVKRLDIPFPAMLAAGVAAAVAVPAAWLAVDPPEHLGALVRDLRAQWRRESSEVPKAES